MHQIEENTIQLIRIDRTIIDYNLFFIKISQPSHFLHAMQGHNIISNISFRQKKLSYIKFCSVS